MKILRWMLISVILALGTAPLAKAALAVVRAVLFFSPACRRSEKVITQDLPPLIEKYGQQLNIIGIDVTQAVGQALFQSAIQHFNC